MKLSLLGLMKLKPFDETDEKPKAGSIYANSVWFSAVIMAGGFLALAALALGVAGSEYAFNILAIAMCISAVTAGMEWHAGLKAIALNQLFTAVLAALLFNIVGNRLG
ncbi:MAG: hypothetical protein BGO63_10470 [Candidatus Accumulibacter sp. 66-26]|nr:hypothetical protein [Accumulibacter sp.]OJW51547.1 MAG: hypothetical protein BGO63_10470 [Candidatus Accumulibacter sp. 66-26]